jgi:predicted DNA-binding protein with PD1-like motif
MLVRQFDVGRCLMGRLAPGDDLLVALESLVRERNIRSGQVQFLGALQKGALGYYDQNARQYRTLVLDRHLEIAAGAGNVSLRDGQPMVHAHLVLSDEEGRCWGGHLVPGNVVFACEFAILVLEGEPWSRHPDDYTGLTLWT